MADNRTYEYENVLLIPSSTSPGFQKINLEVVDSIDQTGVDISSYPIFASPMDGITDTENWQMWSKNKIKSIIPRTIPLEIRVQSMTTVWTAFSVQEVKDLFLNSDKRGIQSQFHVAIDCGSGNDISLIQMYAKLKQMYGPQLILMAANISNPETYQHIARAGADYVRVGMASGSLVDKDKFGFHYPMASLLMKIQESRKLLIGQGGGKTKVIADGGIKSHSDILKAIALGADYVMIGREFIQLIEAAGSVYKLQRDPSQPQKEWYDEVLGEELELLTPEKVRKHKLFRVYHANTSPEVQALRQGYNSLDQWKKNKPGAKIKSGDGTWEWVRITGSIVDWIAEFREVAAFGFLQTGATTWEEFKTKCKYVPAPN